MVGKETDDLLLPSSLLPSSLLPSSLLQQLVFCTYSLTIFNHCGELIRYLVYQEKVCLVSLACRRMDKHPTGLASFPGSPCVRTKTEELFPYCKRWKAGWERGTYWIFLLSSCLPNTHTLCTRRWRRLKGWSTSLLRSSSCEVPLIATCWSCNELDSRQLRVWLT